MILATFQLVRAIPGFRDMTTINDQRVYTSHLKSLLVPISHLPPRLHTSHLLFQKGALPDPCDCHTIRREEEEGSFALPRAANLASTRVR